ncbi:hypothetical protein B0A50_00453 [Salinomyces thailandicus]|uniref:RING-type domain-containing protein n=1 Tax=Salinomyces thailandicus TaxID=706561 RepID=A0A4U0UEB6_9PEZI|nr:hypothetical protein B0A50_00453 [Salinomyces thailandica]
MADPSGNTPCVQCSCQVSYDDVKRIISRKDIVHYDFLVHRARAEKESLRECLADILSPTKEQTTCHHFQRHDAQTDGRVFKCSQCGNRECTRCAIPEHVNETCDAFQHRMGFEHGGEEHATAEAFSSGYTGLEGSKEVWKRPKPCPCCGVKIEREDKCQHMTCLKCGNQFCIQCNAAFYGERSVPELGNAAHEKDCVYFKHAKEDRRFKRKDRT